MNSDPKTIQNAQLVVYVHRLINWYEFFVNHAFWIEAKTRLGSSACSLSSISTRFFLYKLNSDACEWLILVTSRFIDNYNAWHEYRFIYVFVVLNIRHEFAVQTHADLLFAQIFCLNAIGGAFGNETWVSHTHWLEWKISFISSMQVIFSQLSSNLYKNFVLNFAKSYSKSIDKDTA